MGDDWVGHVARTLLEQFRKQDPGTELLAISCEGAPDLETRAREDSGVVTAVTLRIPLQVLLRDSTGAHWRLRGIRTFAPNATLFQIESTERAG